MKKKVFIDGEEGTTGLQLSEKLKNHPQIELLKINSIKRKQNSEKQKLMGLSDLTFLCLPDNASVESVKLGRELGKNCPIFIDASTAHRVSPNWTYGLPELSNQHEDQIKISKNICVPGCYATGASLIIYPLIKKKLIRNSHNFIIQAISGYSGGGKKLIEYFNHKNTSFFYYGLDLNHKHLPEIKIHNNLTANPTFLPSVANFYQGMIVNIFLNKKDFIYENSFYEIENILSNYYNQKKFISVKHNKNFEFQDGYYKPEKYINSNYLDINIFKHNSSGQLIISSILDNLGKGASGAAIQCMNLRFGFKEELSL